MNQLCKVYEFQYEQDDDFIKSMKLQGDQCVITTENNLISLIEVYESGLSTISQLQCACPVYDVSFDSFIAVSQRDHPINIYDKDFQTLGRISDIKPNSEEFRCPLQMKQINNELFGCGIGFFHSYDFIKMKLRKEYDCVSKKGMHLSAFDLASPQSSNLNFTQNLAIIGLFTNQIIIVDMNNDKILTQIKIHLGGVTQIQFSQENSFYFYSSARKDNLVYEWDLRNTSSFVKYFERKNNTNQRTYFNITPSIQTFGNDVKFKKFQFQQKDGTAYLYTKDQRYQLTVNESHTSVNSIGVIQNKQLIFTCYGERTFDFDGERNQNISGINIYKY